MEVPLLHGFCDNGIDWPSSRDFPANSTHVRITVMEAPLFSIPPKSPTPGELLKAFHVALYFEVMDSSNVAVPGFHYSLEVRTASSDLSSVEFILYHSNVIHHDSLAS